MHLHKPLTRFLGVMTLVGLAFGLIGFRAMVVHAAPLAATISDVVINEVDADTPGTDVLEFVELYDGGDGNTLLDGLVVVFFNGNGDVSYNAFDLDTYSTDADGYFLLGNSGVSPAPDIVFGSNGLQNGADAVAVYMGDGSDFPNGTALTTTGLVDAIVYDTNDGDDSGLLVLLNSSQPQVNEGGGGNSSVDSNQRCPNGSGGSRNTDSYIQASPSPRAENNCAAPPATPATIYDIQFTADPSGDSPLVGQTVVTEGVVTATFTYGYFIQDPSVSDWGGLWVHDVANTPALGDRLELTGDVVEYFNLTELDSISGFAVLSSGETLPDPVILSAADVAQEQWEGMLVRVEGITVGSDLGNGEWEVLDATGTAIVDDKGSYTYSPTSGDSLDFVQGPLDFTYGNFKIQPRDDDDIGVPLDYTPIYDIQYTTDLSGDSPLVGQIVTTEGVVTASFTYGYFIQDPAVSSWGGLWVHDDVNVPALGDRLSLTGEVVEYYNLTELDELTAYSVLSSGETLPGPVVLDTVDVSQEQWESMLVRVEAVQVIDDDLGYGEWSVDDSSGVVRVDDMGSYTYSPASGDLLDFVQGPLSFGFGNFKIEPRDDADIGVTGPPPPPPVPIYDIQYTTDPSGDSPFAGQVVTTQGVVTAIFYNGYFIQDPANATWSGLFVFDVNEPALGDRLQLTGEVSEYYGLTQISKISEYVVQASGQPLPDPAIQSTMNVSQEQWESMLVRVENVTVSNDSLGYGEWSVTDTSGDAVVDDKGSYSYEPKTGDELDYVQGPLDYAYGTFKIQPRDDGDIEFAPPFYPICEIQGAGFESPYANQVVRTEGIVFADFDTRGIKGFYVQDSDCDGDPATSDGIFVYKGNTTDVVSAGDLVQLRGYVKEYYDLTEISVNNADINVVSQGNPLPAPVDLDPPFDNAASWSYLESLEGMYVSMAEAVVVGPTSRYDETHVVRSDLGLVRVFQDQPGGSGVIVGVDDSGSFEITPEVKVGDGVQGLLGALDFNYGYYKMQLTEAPTVSVAPDPPKAGDVDGDGDIDLDDLRMIKSYWGQSVPPAPASADLNGDGRITYRDVLAFLRLYRKGLPRWNEFTVATFNLENLFDTVDEPGKDDPRIQPDDYELKLDKLAEAIHDDLLEPVIIGVQEAENLTVLNDLAARPEIKADYEAILVDGPDGRGIDVGLLYQPGMVRILDYASQQGCTSMVDGLGPDGNRNVYNPTNAITCDTDGDGVNDGNRLFSRPPLVVHLEVGYDTKHWGWRGVQEFYVIVNHFKSKTQDTEEVKYTLPRRLEQAALVAGVVSDIRAGDPGANVIVLGDLNDFLDSDTLAILETAGLANLLFETPKPNRYTYIYQGESEVLDHILITSNLWDEFRSVKPVHINADYPSFYGDIPDLSRRSSDHDAVVAKFRMRMGGGWGW